MVKKVLKRGASLMLAGAIIVGLQGTRVDAFSNGVLGSYSVESFSRTSASGYVSSNSKTSLETVVVGYYYGSGHSLQVEKNSFAISSTGCGCGISISSQYSLDSADYRYSVSGTPYYESRS